MKKVTIGILAFFLLGFPVALSAYTVDFEGTGLSEGQPLTTQISGLTFSNTVIAKEGYPDFAFSEEDTVTSGEPFAGDFITDPDGPPNNHPSPIEVYFAHPVFNLNFVVADLDQIETGGGEGVTASAFDAGNNLLDTLTIMAGEPGTGEMKGTLFELNGDNISRLLITPIGTLAHNDIGWGVDNFSFDSDMNFFDPRTSEKVDFYVNLILDQTISFDYFWEMGLDPPPYDGQSFDVMYLQEDETEGFWVSLGQIAAYNSSDQWGTATFAVPEELWGLETQLRFTLDDFGPITQPTVFLRESIPPPAVPEPTTVLLVGAGLVGIAGFRRRCQR